MRTLHTVLLRCKRATMQKWQNQFKFSQSANHGKWKITVIQLKTSASRPGWCDKIDSFHDYASDSTCARIICQMKMNPCDKLKTSCANDKGNCLLAGCCSNKQNMHLQQRAILRSEHWQCGDDFAKDASARNIWSNEMCNLDWKWAISRIHIKMLFRLRLIQLSSEFHGMCSSTRHCQSSFGKVAKLRHQVHFDK